MKRFTHRIALVAALVAAGAGVLAGAAVGVAQAAAPDAPGAVPVVAAVVPDGDCGDVACGPDCPPGTVPAGDQCTAPDRHALPAGRDGRGR